MKSFVQKPVNGPCFYLWIMKPNVYKMIKGLADGNRFRKTWRSRWQSVRVVMLYISLAYG